MAEIILTGSCGDNATYNLYDDGLLEILGTGDMENYANAKVVPWDDYTTAITKITIANGITRIGDYSFIACHITEITIPSSVLYIRPYSFTNCKQLTSVKISDGTTYIGSYAFMYCTALVNLTIGNKVAQIANMAFDGCTSLTSVAIPESVTTIEAQAFGHCTNLELITMLGTTPPTLTYRNIFIGADSLRINVPFSALDVYKTAIYWKGYANIIHGIESLAELFTRIANSIRSKTGKTDSIVAQNFPEEIEKISSNS